MKQLKQIRIRFSAQATDLFENFKDVGDSCVEHLYRVGRALINGKQNIEGEFWVLADGTLRPGVLVSSSKDNEYIVDLFDGNNVGSLVTLGDVQFAIANHSAAADLSSKIDVFDVHAHLVDACHVSVRIRMNRNGTFYIDHIRRIYEANKVELPHQVPREPSARTKATFSSP